MIKATGVCLAAIDTGQECRSATMLEIMSFRQAGGRTIREYDDYENYLVPLCLSPLDGVGLCFFY